MNHYECWNNIHDHKHNFQKIFGETHQSVRMSPTYGVFNWTSKAVKRVTHVLTTLHKLSCSAVHTPALESVFQNHRECFPVSPEKVCHPVPPPLTPTHPLILPLPLTLPSYCCSSSPRPTHSPSLPPSLKHYNLYWTDCYRR